MSIRNMAFVPFIVSNRRNRGYRLGGSGGIIAIVIMLFVFGFLFFLLFNRFDGFMSPMIFMISGFSIFFVIVMLIAVVAASMSAYKKPKEDYIKSYQYQPEAQIQQQNPYIIKNSTLKQPEEPIYEEVKLEIPKTIDISYCRYCGAKVDKGAVFCHMCGVKL